MISIRLLTIAIVLLASSTTALAQGSALPTLRRADSVIAGVRTAVYDAENINWNIDGSVDTARGRIFIERHGIADGVGLKLRFETDGLVTAYDGTRMLWLDRAEKKVVQADSTFTFASYLNGNYVGQFIRGFFLRKKPYAALDGEATAEGVVDIAGIPSNAVRIRIDDDETFKQGRSRLAFGVADGFPRRYEFSGLYEGQKYADTLTLSNVRLNVPLDDTVFALRTPPGYTFEVQKPYVRPRLLADGSDLPAFSLRATNGATITAESLRGKVTVLDFWYVACAPCIQAMPKLSEVQKRFGTDDVVVLGVNIRDTPEKTRELLAAKGVVYHSLLDGMELATSLGISGYPTMFVIGRNGRVVRALEGTSDDLEARLSTVIEEALKAR